MQFHFIKKKPHILEIVWGKKFLKQQNKAVNMIAIKHNGADFFRGKSHYCQKY